MFVRNVSDKPLKIRKEMFYNPLECPDAEYWLQPGEEVDLHPGYCLPRKYIDGSPKPSTIEHMFPVMRQEMRKGPHGDYTVEIPSGQCALVPSDDEEYQALVAQKAAPKQQSAVPTVEQYMKMNNCSRKVAIEAVKVLTAHFLKELEGHEAKAVERMEKVKEKRMQKRHKTILDTLKTQE